MFKYGMKERGFGMGCQPKGFVKYEDIDHPYYYSYVWYEQPLTQEQLEQFEMEQIDERPIEEKIMEVLDDLRDSELVAMWNTYCYENNYVDDVIYDTTVFEDFCKYMTHTDVLMDMIGNNFNIHHRYFKHGVNGFESSNFGIYWIDEDMLIDYFITSNDALGNSDIREILERDN